MNVVTWMKTEIVGSSKWLWDAQSTDISQHALMSPIFFIDKQDVFTYMLCCSEDQGKMWALGSCGSLAQIPTMAFSVASESMRWMKLWNLQKPVDVSPWRRCSWLITVAVMCVLCYHITACFDEPEHCLCQPEEHVQPNNWPWPVIQAG